MGDSAVFSQNFGMLILILTQNVAIFYILQIRELQRFFEQQTSAKKEQQMSHVLDAQSDAIVVVHKVKSKQNKSEID